MNHPADSLTRVRALFVELMDEAGQGHSTALILLTPEWLTKLNAKEISADVIALRRKHHGLWSVTFEVNLSYLTPHLGTFDLLEPLVGMEKAEACETELLENSWTVVDLPASALIAGTPENFDSAHFHICQQGTFPGDVTVEIHLTITRADQRFPFVLATATFPVSALTSPAAG